MKSRRRRAASYPSLAAYLIYAALLLLELVKSLLNRPLTPSQPINIIHAILLHHCGSRRGRRVPTALDSRGRGTVFEFPFVHTYQFAINFALA